MEDTVGEFDLCVTLEAQKHKLKVASEWNELGKGFPRHLHIEKYAAKGIHDGTRR